MKPISRLILSALVALSFAMAIAGQSGPSKDDLFKQVEKSAKGKKFEEQRATLQLARDYMAQFGKEDEDKAKKVRDITTAIKVDWRSQIGRLIQTRKNADTLKAYELAKIMVEEFQGENDEFVNGTKNFISKNRETFFNLLIDANRNSDAFLLGEQILNDKPDNLYVKLNMPILAQDVWLKEKDKSFVKDGIAYAQEAAKEIEGGATATSFAPFKDRDEALANMYWIVGILKGDTDLQGSAQSLHKANTLSPEFMKRSYGFAVLASYYEARYNNRIKEFNMKYPSGRVTNEIADKEEAVRKDLLDRLLDSYARAIKNARAENSPGAQPLTEAALGVYQRRRGSAAGFEEFVNNIMSTPLPSFQ